MSGIGALAIAFAICWLAAYLSKRRFGVLGLALTAGALMASLWSPELLVTFERWGISITGLSTPALVSVVLVLAPALLLLLSGPAYHSKGSRLAGGLLFAAFATVLLAPTLGELVPLDGMGQDIFDTIEKTRHYSVTAGVIVAILDLWYAHGVRGHGREDKKK